MNRLQRYMSACVFGLLALFILQPLHAATPTVVLSISSIEELLDNADFIGGAVGQEGLKAMAEANVNAFTGGAGLAGVDQEKPLGVYWNIAAPAPDDIGKAVLYLPVSDVEAFKKLMSMFAPDLKDNGGNWTLSFGGTKLFATVSEDYCYLCTSKEGLADLADPDKLSSDKYDISIDVNLGSIPKPMKATFLQITESSGRKSLSEKPQPDSQTEAIAQRLGFDWSIAAITAIVNDGDHLSWGIAVDSEARTATTDLSLTSKPNTALAKAMAAYEKTVPVFATVAAEDAPFRLILSHPTGWLADSSGPLFDAIRKDMEAQIDKDEKLTDAGDKKAAKDVAKRFANILQATIGSGSAHSVLILDEGTDDTVSLVGGIKLAKGDDAAKLLDDLVKLSKENPDFAKVKLDVAKHAGARIHEITPDLDDKASALFGEGPAHIAFRSDSLWIAMGGGNLDALKAALDASGKRASKTNAPIFIHAKPAALVTLMEEDDEALIKRAEELDGEPGDTLKIEIAPIEGNGAKLHFEFGVDLFKLSGNK